MKYPFLKLLLLLFFVVSAEEVCKFSYRNDPGVLDGKELQLPHGTVAMSEFIKITNESNIIQTGGASSVFFVIDNSNSMFIKNNGSGSGIKGFDIDGARYSATKSLIDSIYAVSPESEVGLALFSTFLYFDTNDDPLFKPVVVNKKIYDLRGGYIPLLKLNEVVTEGKYAGMTGYETLKSILTLKLFEGRKIKTYTGAYLDIPPYTNLEYEPSNYWLDPVKIKEVGGQAGTNIWGGFAAAKEAMLSSSYSEENHHIIFYSDGSAMTFDNEAPRVWWEDSTAENCPATYTVFFDEDNENAVSRLEKLNSKISNNNYSQSNLNSELWAMSAGHDVLVNLLMKNVIKEIITNITTVIPTDIKVKGVSPIKTWDGNGFLFQSEFPLIGPKTLIEYSIDYSIVKDSISGGDTITIPIKDTSIDVSYDAIIVNNPVTPDSCKLSWWGRNLSLKENGAELVIIDDRDGIVDINFKSYKVDTIYNYDSVEIEITTESGDSEKVVLSKSGNEHTFSIDRKIGTANSDDGVIQYNSVDKITFKFRNSLLALDTLEKIVTVEAQGMLVVKDIIYKDSDANGYLDKVAIKVSGDDLSVYAQEIIDEIIFPVERDIIVDSFSVQSDRIIVSVSERSGVIRTAIESFDSYTLSDTVVLTNDAILAPFSLQATDSVAPVILSASLVDSVKDGADDYLTIEYSETVENENSDNCLSYYENGTSLSLTVSSEHVSTSSNIAIYKLISHNLNSGDSVNINNSISNPIKDVKDNVQNNKNNRRVEIDITLIEDRLYVLSASYYDDNADGWVDRIGVNLSKEIDSKYLNQIVQNIDLGTSRNLGIDSSRYGNGIVNLFVSETGSDKNTATDNDVISVNDSIVLSNELILTPSSINVADSMAPVVLSAILEDSVKSGSYDYLIVSFSEEVQNVSDDKSLNFYKNGSSALFNENLELAKSISDTVVYRIADCGISVGDSLNINSKSLSVIRDPKGNEQNEYENIKVEIDVILIEDNLFLTGSSFHDDNADGWVDRISLILNNDIDNGLLNDFVDKVDLGNLRLFDIDTKSCDDNIVTLFVTENSAYHLTSTINEVVKINDSLKLSDDLILIPSEVSVDDSMAPVIVEAHLYDSVITETKGKETYISKKGDDFLIITCSEEIEEVEGINPFSFHHGGIFDVSVEVKSINGEKIECRVIDRNIIKDGDSVSLNFNDKNFVSDLTTLKQENNKNRRCPINITIIEAQSFVPADISFILKSTILDYQKKISIPEDWETEDGKSGIEKGVMVLTLEPDDKENFTHLDEIIVDLSVYDNLGNLIKENMGMTFDIEKKTSHLLWSGKNSSGRLVGSGAYIVIGKVKRYFDGDLMPVQAIKITAGVKCSKD